MSKRTEIELEAQLLDVGETLNGLLCPFCEGGRTGEHTFSITRIDDGLLHNCYRASCDDGRGFVATGAVLRQAGPPKQKRSEPYTGTFEALEEKDYVYFSERFDLDRQYLSHMGRNSDGYYVQALVAPNGMHRGYAVRLGCWSGGPRCPRNSRSFGPKTKLYLNDSQQVPQSWYRYTLGRVAHVVLVEDAVSAMKVQQAGHAGVALFGTNLTATKVREIGMQHPVLVSIALDADATDVAFEMAREWGLAFPRTRVIVLERDLKDISKSEVVRILS